MHQPKTDFSLLSVALFGAICVPAPSTSSFPNGIHGAARSFIFDVRKKAESSLRVRVAKSDQLTQPSPSAKGAPPGLFDLALEAFHNEPAVIPLTCPQISVPHGEVEQPAVGPLHADFADTVDLEE